MSRQMHDPAQERGDGYPDRVTFDGVERRNTIANEIYDECAHTLVRASNAFRKARAEL